MRQKKSLKIAKILRSALNVSWFSHSSITFLHNGSLSLFIIFPKPAKYLAEPPNLPETLTLRDPGPQLPGVSQISADI